jgi:hypothetical protein
MKIGNKTKVAKEITRQERNRRNNIRRITVSAIVALILFIGLLVIQSSILNQEEKLQVYQVVKDIGSGTKITEDNIDTYLDLKEVQLSLIPDDYITNPEMIIGKFVNRDYKAKDIITSDGLTDTEALYLKNIENPVEVSFSASDISTAVAGTIREGDYINIYGMRKQDSTTSSSWYSTSALTTVDEYYTFRHLYVFRAFTSSGSRITGTETNGDESLVFSVVINEKDVELFNEMITNCSIRVSRLRYDTEEDYQQFLDSANSSAAVANKTTTESTGTSTSSVTNDSQIFWETLEDDEELLEDEDYILEDEDEALLDDTADTSDEDANTTDTTESEEDNTNSNSNSEESTENNSENSEE